MNLLTIFIFFTYFVLSPGEKVRYDNYRVYSIKIKNEKQLKVLQVLDGFQDGISYIEAPVSTHRTAEMLVSPHKFSHISEFLQTYELEHDVKVEDLQKLIDEEPPKSPSNGEFGWDRYHDLKSINKWLNEQLKQYPDLLTNYNGKSYEKRDLRDDRRLRVLLSC